jgi:hypothetical protein
MLQHVSRLSRMVSTCGADDPIANKKWQNPLAFVILLSSFDGKDHYSH